MGYEILVALFMTVLLPVVLLGFIVFWAMTSRERAFIEDSWRSYAVTRHREYVPARGEWPNRTSPSVRWMSDELRLELSVVGAEANARTRLIAWPRGKLLGNFTVGPKSRHRGSGGIADPAFESAYGVTERPNGLAARVLDEPARRALLGFRLRDDVMLTYRRGKLILEWPGRESNDARLDEAARVIRELARGVDDAFREPALVAGERATSMRTQRAE